MRLKIGNYKEMIFNKFLKLKNKYKQYTIINW